MGLVFGFPGHVDSTLHAREYQSPLILGVNFSFENEFS